MGREATVLTTDVSVCSLSVPDRKKDKKLSYRRETARQLHMST